MHEITHVAAHLWDGDLGGMKSKHSLAQTHVCTAALIWVLPARFGQGSKGPSQTFPRTAIVL